MTIDGINASSDGLTTCTMGTTIVGPQAYYHPKASANVLSFGDVVDQAESVTYEKREDRFVVQWAEGQDA
jgi:hypothetical protein